MGTLTNSTAEVQEQIDGVYAEIYVHEGVTAQSIPTGAGYTKVTGFASSGASNNATADAANDKITLTKNGDYKIECSLSFTGSGISKNWFGVIFADGVEQDKIHFQRKIGTGGDYGSTQFGGLITVSGAPVDIDIRVRHDDGGALDFTPIYLNMNAIRVGL